MYPSPVVLPVILLLMLLLTQPVFLLSFALSPLACILIVVFYAVSAYLVPKFIILWMRGHGFARRNEYITLSLYYIVLCICFAAMGGNTMYSLPLYVCTLANIFSLLTDNWFASDGTALVFGVLCTFCVLYKGLNIFSIVSAVVLLSGLILSLKRKYRSVSLTGILSGFSIGMLAVIVQFAAISLT